MNPASHPSATQPAPAQPGRCAWAFVILAGLLAGALALTFGASIIRALFIFWFVAPLVLYITHRGRLWPLALAMNLGAWLVLAGGILARHVPLHPAALALCLILVAAPILFFEFVRAMARHVV